MPSAKKVPRSCSAFAWLGDGSARQAAQLGRGIVRQRQLRRPIAGGSDCSAGFRRRRRGGRCMGRRNRRRGPRTSRLRGRVAEADTCRTSTTAVRGAASARRGSQPSAMKLPPPVRMSSAVTVCQDAVLASPVQLAVEPHITVGLGFHLTSSPASSLPRHRRMGIGPDRSLPVPRNGACPVPCEGSCKTDQRGRLSPINSRMRS